MKSFFTKKKNTSSFSNSIQDAAAAGCSSWRGGSTKKSPFSSPCKIPVAATGDIDHNNNITQPSQSPRKKIYYSEKQSDDINGAPSVPPTTPGIIKIGCDYKINLTTFGCGGIYWGF